MARQKFWGSLACLLFVLTVCTFSSNQVQGKGQVCPLMLKKLIGNSEICDKVKCKSYLKPESCSEDTTFQEKIDSCGCCPACMKVKEVGESESCGKETAAYEECGKKICPIIVQECSAGFHCDEASKTCLAVPPAPRPDPNMTCAMKLAIFKAESRTHYYTPRCKANGMYAPVQCKGKIGQLDAACFCTTEKGERIFGRKHWTLETEETMDCACSLHVHELKSKGLLTTLHCTLDGSYEKLQCDGDTGLCYCVDPKTGETTGAVLPESQWNQLPCYSPDMGENYLRQCDSQWLATERIKLEASLHGLTKINKYTEFDCDYDGSFKRVQRRGLKETCVYKNELPIGSYTRVRGGNMQELDCNCARLATDYEAENMTIPTDAPGCVTDLNAMGNFKPVHTAGSVVMCIDKDGYPYYEVPDIYSCCLEDSLCDADNCFNEGKNPNGWRTCSQVVS